MTSAFRSVTAGLALGAGAVLAVPHAALAAVPTTPAFSASPATSDPNDPLTRSYFRPVATPGSTVAEGAVVTDTGDTPVDLYVYAVDGLTGATSGTVYANHSDPRQKAGAWLTPGTSMLTLQPHQRQLVLFRIDVPATATPGDHVAGIAFENAHPTTGGGLAVTEIIREVIGVQVRVPGPGEFHLKLSGIHFAVPPDAAAASVVVRLGDDGNRLGQPKLAITLHGPAGFTDTLTRQLDTLLPGDTIDYPIAWPRPLPAGPYTVDVTQVGVPDVSLSAPANLSTAQPGLPKVPATAPPAQSPAAPPAHPKPAQHGHDSSAGWMVFALVVAGGLVTGVAAMAAVRLASPKRRARRRHPSSERSARRRDPVTGAP
ncbi:MAG TPA: hypothetical protein VFA83_12210 [Acidimicrobiales bacterium]|nr:hypothetical protein [Acidimicrobiales bacterium]